MRHSKPVVVLQSDSPGSFFGRTVEIYPLSHYSAVGQILTDQIETPAAALRGKRQPAIQSDVAWCSVDRITADEVVVRGKIGIQLRRQPIVPWQLYAIRRRQTSGPLRSGGRCLPREVIDRRHASRKLTQTIRRSDCDIRAINLQGCPSRVWVT